MTRESCGKLFKDLEVGFGGGLRTRRIGFHSVMAAFLLGRGTGGMNMGEMNTVFLSKTKTFRLKNGRGGRNPE